MVMREAESGTRTVWRFLAAPLPRVAAVLVPTMMKPPPEVAAEPVVVGELPVVALSPLATIRPPPEVGVVRDDEAEAVKG